MLQSGDSNLDPHPSACAGRAIIRPMTDTPRVKPDAFKVACSSCNLRELCLPVGLGRQDLERLDTLVATRRTVERGDTLFRVGDGFQSLYAVRTGFFRT